ncbi:hypothetical protein GCM10023317_38680 [Actinopolymorpha pittospori]
MRYVDPLAPIGGGRGFALSLAPGIGIRHGSSGSALRLPISRLRALLGTRRLAHARIITRDPADETTARSGASGAVAVWALGVGNAAGSPRPRGPGVSRSIDLAEPATLAVSPKPIT